MNQLYRSFSSYLRECFGKRVYRVPLDAGFTCPNRDGERAFGGCTFCDDSGSGSPTIRTSLTIEEQLANGIEHIRRKFKAHKFLAYFQAFTNTYASESVLRSLYDAALTHPDVIGLCIGTRPDCLPDNIVDLLEQYHKRTFVWLEVGLQSAFNDTLQAINRGHSVEEFFDAVYRVKKRGMRVATHVIFGLPGENRERMMETVKQVVASGVDGIKIHQLVIYKGTPMELDYRAGILPALEEDYYVDLVVNMLEILPPQMIVMRLVAEGSQNEVVAPLWSLQKERIMKKIEAEMIRRGTRQGCRYSPPLLAAGTVL